MGGKGGGSVDTTGLEEATREATQLQRDIYDQTRTDVQPWYDMGVGAVGRLSDLLGISGGSVQSRDSIYNDLLPQYTTQQTTGGGGAALLTSPDGSVINLDNRFGPQLNEIGELRKLYDAGNYERLSDMGYNALNPTTTSEMVDYEGLNAAVDARIAEQGDTPEGYGSLLERFDLDKFEADPSYQFRQDEANKALERQLAAQGVTLGGAGYGEINPQASRYIQELNQNLASQEYGNAYNRYVQDQLNTFNMLTGAAGMGQGSTGILATSGQNYANNVGNLQTGLASAQLNAQLSNQSQPSMFGSLLGGGLQLAAGLL